MDFPIVIVIVIVIAIEITEIDCDYDKDYEKDYDGEWGLEDVPRQANYGKVFRIWRCFRVAFSQLTLKLLE